MHRRHSSLSGNLLIGAIAVVAIALALASVALVSSHHHPTSAGASSVPTTKQGTPIVEEVTATSPSSGTTDVSPSSDLTVVVSEPLASRSPMPELSPAVAGSWHLTTPTTLVFQPSASFVPGATETVSVPAGPGGLLGVDHERTSEATSVHFTIAEGSTLRLQQLLAELGYLPVSFTPASAAPVSALDEAVPQTGTFSWRWATLPSSLTSLWSPGTANVITRGAVMQFELEEHLTTDGIAGPEVWRDLLRAVAIHSADPLPYDYVYVQKTPEPENVTVYSDGRAVYNTLANTGIAAAPTPDGTWPVYARYEVTTMTGTNPDGSHYSDPGIPWVSYFNGGDALHGFIRASYGFPQSLGCVEMPFANAAVVYPYTPIGTLVTVQ